MACVDPMSILGQLATANHYTCLPHTRPPVVQLRRYAQHEGAQKVRKMGQWETTNKQPKR